MADVLLTGSTGVVGAELTRVLAARTDARLCVVLRGDARERDAKVRWLAQWAGVPSARIEAVAGDVRAPDLGLSRADRDRIATVDTVIHAAADTSFAQTREDASASNVGGTRHVLALAAGLRRLRRFAHVSTAFVCGVRGGRVAEGDRFHPDGEFDNEYERSKVVAENAVHASALPTVVFRPSIVVGRATDGRIARMRDAVYFMIRRIHEGMLPMFPSGAGSRVDFVPVDFVARAMVHLTLDRFAPGGTYHVCSGAERSVTVDDFMDIAWRAFASADPRWRRRGYPRPEAVSTETFDDFLGAVALVGHARLRELAATVHVLRKPLAHTRTFDTRCLARALAGSGIALAPAREWLPVVVAHAANERFRTRSWREVADGR